MTQVKCAVCVEKWHDSQYEKCYGCMMLGRENYTLCGACGEKRHDPKYDMCYSCSMAAKGAIVCVACERNMHDPQYDTCYTCSQGEPMAAERPTISETEMAVNLYAPEEDLPW